MAEYYGPAAGREMYFRNMGLSPDGVTPLGGAPAPAPVPSMSATIAPQQAQSAEQAGSQYGAAQGSPAGNFGRYGQRELRDDTLLNSDDPNIHTFGGSSFDTQRQPQQTASSMGADQPRQSQPQIQPAQPMRAQTLSEVGPQYGSMQASTGPSLDTQRRNTSMRQSAQQMAGGMGMGQPRQNSYGFAQPQQSQFGVGIQRTQRPQKPTNTMPPPSAGQPKIGIQAQRNQSRPMKPQQPQMSAGTPQRSHARTSPSGGAV